MSSTSSDVPQKDASRRRIQRRLSNASHLCHPLSPPLDPLDLSALAPIQALASLRFLLLSHLAHLETCLAQLDTVDLGITETLKAKSGLTIDEAKQWARTALEMLEGIKDGVRSHLPELHFTDVSVENFKSHFPDVPNLTEMRTHLPDVHLPSLQDFPAFARHAKSSVMKDVRSHFPDLDFKDMRAKLEDVRSRFHDMDFHQLPTYIPDLSERLRSLHSHLSSMELPSSIGMPSSGPCAMLSDLLDAFVTSDIFSELLLSPDALTEGDRLLEAGEQIARALKQSLGGVRLIKYDDIPHLWRSNPFVVHGYRFIPIERWPLILMSLLQFHNETLNIHTHLVPFVIWAVSMVPFFNDPYLADLPEMAFTLFVLLCLLLSITWHIMSGCAHYSRMLFCARLDYVGIGWLISASVGTVMHYGFQCYPTTGNICLAFCFVMGVAGTIFPFMEWFNAYEYRFWRISFFVALVLSAIVPTAYMSSLYSPLQVLRFISPVFPSLASYVIGVGFYATHVPERFLPARWCVILNSFGCGSHAIWHCFIVLAICQHKAAIATLRRGFGDVCH